MTKASAGEVIKLHFHDETGLTGRHSGERFVLQRLRPPGALPVKPGGLINFSSLLVIAGRSSLRMEEVNPTWSSVPSPL